MTEASHVRPISSDRGAGAGGGGKGGQLPPPNFLSEGDEYACAPPPKFWQSLGISTCLPPQDKNRSRAPVFRPGYTYKVT